MTLGFDEGHAATSVYVINHPAVPALRTCLCSYGPVGCSRECVGDSWYCAECSLDGETDGACASW